MGRKVNTFSFTLMAFCTACNLIGHKRYRNLHIEWIVKTFLKQIQIQFLCFFAKKANIQSNKKWVGKSFSHWLFVLCNIVALVLALICFLYQSSVKGWVTIIASMEKHSTLLWCMEKWFAKGILREFSWIVFYSTLRSTVAIVAFSTLMVMWTVA